jgi:hypothetical protein
MPYKKAVTFTEAKDRVHSILALIDYTRLEIQATWYNGQDYTYFKQDCIKTVRKMEKKGNTLRSKYCTRGLERWTESGSRVVRSTRLEAYDAVLDEQLYQWESGHDDPMSIAQLYSKISSPRQCIANLFALGDAREVEGYYIMAEQAQSGVRNTITISAQVLTETESVRSTNNTKSRQRIRTAHCA